MTSAGQTICLCMIVKDEAPVIRRCLASVRSLLDHWIVLDTGSSDGTQDIVRAAMAGVPGALVERPWVDFAHNRSEALALARPHADYSLIIDADDELVLAPGLAMPRLEADSYTIDIHYGATRYRRPQLVRNALAWRYRGVLHEFLDCPDATTQHHLPIVMKINHEGRRSSDPATYAKDATTLEAALARETDPLLVARYTFYLAQSYRDCGERERSLALYLRRADLGFWIEEVYVSLLQAGRLMEALGGSMDEALATYARASAVCPSRAEAAHAASHLCRMLSRFAQGHAIARAAFGLPEPAAGLFTEGWIYDYGLYDEFAVNAYWAGHYRDCLNGCLRALQSGKLPADQVPRFYANMRFALEKEPTASRGAQPAPEETRGPPPLSDEAPPCAIPTDDGLGAACSIATLMSAGEGEFAIVDVGAASFGEKQFYQPLLDRHIGTLTSFEPDPGNYEKLVGLSDERDTILPVALGDGAEHTLHLAPGGMTSIFEADQASYNLFELLARPPFSPAAESWRTQKIQTSRLDDLEALQQIDLFKIDIQGAELMVLQHGRSKLRNCSIIQVEMPFVSLYKGQPSYGELDTELHAQGFMVHGFATIKRLPMHPYGEASPRSGINQLIDLDMIYIRDMRHMETVSTHVLRATAVLADMCYGSYDLTLRCLHELARRNLIASEIPKRYEAAASKRTRIGYIHYTPYVE